MKRKMRTSLRTTLTGYTLLLILIVGCSVSAFSIWRGRELVAQSYHAKYSKKAKNFELLRRNTGQQICPAPISEEIILF